MHACAYLAPSTLPPNYHKIVNIDKKAGNQQKHRQPRLAVIYTPKP